MIEAGFDHRTLTWAEERCLTELVADPHPKMPDLNLSRSEIADFVAHIGSLHR